jgi:hypothetical protein
MEKRTAKEMFELDSTTVEGFVGTFNWVIKKELTARKVELNKDITYKVTCLVGTRIYVELEVNRVRPDVKPGKTYTEEFIVLVDVSEMDTETMDDLNEELAKVLMQISWHGTLSYATAKRLEHDYRAKIDVRQPELEIKGVLR